MKRHLAAIVGAAAISTFAADQTLKAVFPVLDTTQHLAPELIIIAILALVGSLFTIKGSMQRIILASMIGAGASNVYDRLFLGEVRDIFQVSVIYFNLADVLLINGALMFALVVLRQSQKTHKPTSVKM